MATFSRAELRNAVMYELGALDPNESIRAEDAVTVNNKAQSVLEYLQGEGLIPFDLDSDSFPSPYLAPLAPLIAAELVNTFVAPQERAALKAVLEADSAKAMRKLRRMKAAPYFGSVAPATYY